MVPRCPFKSLECRFKRHRHSTFFFFFFFKPPSLSPPFFYSHSSSTHPPSSHYFKTPLFTPYPLIYSQCPSHTPFHPPLFLQTPISLFFHSLLPFYPPPPFWSIDIHVKLNQWKTIKHVLIRLVFDTFPLPLHYFTGKIEIKIYYFPLLGKKGEK